MKSIISFEKKHSKSFNTYALNMSKQSFFWWQAYLNYACQPIMIKPAQHFCIAEKQMHCEFLKFRIDSALCLKHDAYC